MRILLLAGLWLDARAWDAVVPHLEAAGHTPVALTLPGQGDGRPNASLEDQLDAVLAEVDAASVPVVVVGHSAASTLAWLAADRRPEKVRRVVLVGGFPNTDSEGYAPWFDITEGDLAFPGWEPFGGADSADMTDELKARMEAVLVTVPADVTNGTVRYEDERRHDVPVTLVCPEFDPHDAEEWIENGDLPELAAAHSLEMVDIDSGHWPMFSAPEALASAIAGAAAS